MSGDDVVEVVQRVQTSLRKATAVGDRLVVEAVERSLPGSVGCRSITQFLVQTQRISGGDAAARVKRARKTGIWHTVSGESMDPTLPETAAAVWAGAIGAPCSRWRRRPGW
ncbi:DUF222 domain-containing protein [Rhodococcus sp. NPDC003318]|uniref:DUF222 domain-containing protein n=1 Tax=Rhodococcus sp. NPDC003318 TaxID=3364503 RepID=UPI0036B52B36